MQHGHNRLGDGRVVVVGERVHEVGDTPADDGLIRKRIEEAFGWAKTVAGLRKVRHRGLPKVDWQFTLAMTAYNLVRLPKLLAKPA